MRNYDARMTGEVHRRFREQRRNRPLLPELRSVIAVVAVCLAIYSVTAPTLRAAPQQNASGSNPERVSRPAVITAKPERVTLGEGSGSTEIEWDTGDGSMGFVFVTEDTGKPVLFATGSRGSEVAPWIGKHTYVFELYDRLALRPARIQIPAYVCAFLALELFPATGPVPFVYFQF